MPNILVLTEIVEGEIPREGTPPIRVTGATHVGRSKKEDWIEHFKSKDIKLEELKNPIDDLEQVIALDPKNMAISRSHAYLIYNDGWRIGDFKSMNGTYVNGTRITEEAILNGGDIIGIADGNGRGPRFRVSFENPPGRAILIGNSGGDLQGTRNDIAHFGEKLDERGFLLSPYFDEQANMFSLNTELENVRNWSQPHSYFIFYYTGHGTSNGIHLYERRFDPRIGKDVLVEFEASPQYVFDMFEGIDGKMVLIADACKSGEISANKKMIPQNMLVMMATSPFAKTNERSGLTTRGNGYMGEFTYEIVKYFNEHPGAFRLNDMDDYFRQGKLMGRLPFVKDIFYHGPRTTDFDLTIFEVAPGKFL